MYTLLTHVYSSHTMNWVPNIQHIATPSKSLKMAPSRKMTPLQKTPVLVSILCTIYDTGLTVIKYCVTVVHCEVIGQTDHSPTHLFPMFSEQKEVVWHMCEVLEKDCGKCVFCLDKKKFGGQGKKKCCVRRICTNPSGIRHFNSWSSCTTHDVIHHVIVFTGSTQMSKTTLLVHEFQQVSIPT